ncbi:MAG: hypothetical protein Q3M30_11395 [Candidatus Electrothrix sp. Rat3]|nr:hypothetical protein [Candidatus Electrothrix rattekaaiensis]
METDCSLELRIGKPHIDHDNKDDTRIATFTRFVLPFAYKLEEQQASPPSSPSPLHYTLNPLSDLSFLKRKKYFTRETGRILYEQALWLDICADWSETAWGKAEVEIILRDRSFKIGMKPPRITLFEAAGGQGGDIPARLAAQKEADIRHTGFLQVDLYFPEEQENKPELDDLLLFNEMFRYYDMPYDAHLEHFIKSFGKVPVRYSGTEPFLTVAELAEGDAEAAAQHCYFDRWANLLEIPLVFNNRRYRLFPQAWAEAGRAWTCGKERKITSTHWQIYDENRAYVWTAAFLAEGGRTLQKCFAPDKDTLQAGDYGHWIKLLNVDAPDYNFAEKKYYPPAHTHQSSQFEQKWAEQRTYKRWEEGGTWYGFCYHGGAVLGPPLFNVFHPVESYYFDALMLLFFIRMSLFRFSKALSDILMDEQGWDSRREDLIALRKKFTRFTVLYRYPIVSNQQQMLELYELQHACFDIERFFKEVQVEIDHTHEFLEVLEANRLADAANNLATYGIPLAVLAVLAALLAVPNLHLIDVLDHIPEWGVVLLAFLVPLRWLKNKKPTKNKGAE